MIKSAPAMAEVEAYILQRQREIVASDHATIGASGSSYVALGLGAVLFAIVLFAQGSYFFGAYFLAVVLFFALRAIWDQRKPRYNILPLPTSNRPEMASVEAPFPSAEALFARASEQDRQLLSLPIPRPVHILPRKRVVEATLFVLGLYALFLWGSLHPSGLNRRTGPSTPNAAMTVLGTGILAVTLFYLFDSLRKARRLLTHGQSAPGLVIIKAEGRRGSVQVWYDFRDATGRVRTAASSGSHWRYKDYPAAGHVITVFYDPATPKRQTPYCMSPCEIVMPGSSGHAGPRR